jgi:Trk K+ transport system NAD-binding subunit
VLAITGDDEANQTISIGTRVLDPTTAVIARVADPVVQANLDEFGGVHVVNPFRTFASNIGMAFAAPEVLQLEEWLTGAPGADRPEPLRLPRGHWVLAGYGRFGRPLAAALGAAGQSWRAFDPRFVPPDEAEDRVQACGGTEEGLREAGIDRAVGVIAGTDSDTVNLAVVKMARRANPAAAVIVRQNRAYNRALIDAAEPTVAFVQGELMVHEVLQSLTTPLLERFLEFARQGDGAVAREACTRLEAAFGTRVPWVWIFDCDPDQPGLRQALSTPCEVLTVGELLRDPRDPSIALPAMPLLLARGFRTEPMADRSTAGERRRAAAGRAARRPVNVLDRAGIGVARGAQRQDVALPGPETALAPGDRLLFAGEEWAEGI